MNNKIWIVGHSAIAYLVIKSIYLGFKKEISPRLLIFIFIFANILDSLHFGSLRWISHNLIGAIVYSGIWIIIFIKLKLVYKKEIIILYIAVFTHILGDVMCASFSFFVPFSYKPYSIWHSNTIEHLSFESILFLLFIIMFISSKDYQNLKIYLKMQKQEIKQLYFEKHIF